jgi:arabinose-5-phosphate isomerase
MTVDRKSIHSGMLGAKVRQIIDSIRINALPVGNAENDSAGALNMHDLLRAGVL